MDGAQSDEPLDMNAASRAKRLFVSIEPLPDRRIYRIDQRGIESYDDDQVPEERLKFLAQLIHEPERPEVDASRQTIDKHFGLAVDQFTRLKNVASRLASAESEFTVSQVDAPPPDPVGFENVVMAAYQGRQLQLKKSSDLLTGVLSKLRQTVQHQRAFHEDFQTLRRSRWKLNSPDQDWRSDTWNEPLNAIVKRLSNTYRSLDVFRTSDGNLSTYFPHQHTGILFRVEAHDLNHHLTAPYFATGIRYEIGDLYRPLSNTYIARSKEDIHRLWLWITKSYEDYMLWTTLRKAAITEGLETRDEEILISMPNSPVVFSIHALKPKHTVPKTTQNHIVEPQPDTMGVDPQGTRTPSADPTSATIPSKKRKSHQNEHIEQQRAVATQLDDHPRFEQTFANEEDQYASYLVSNMESDFDVSVTQDLLLLALKQATLIMQHGQTLDQVRFPLFPLRRIAAPIYHPCFQPAISTCHHFRQLLEISRLLDDLVFTLPRSTLLGPLQIHFEPTSLSTTSTLNVTFGTLNRQYSIQNGKFSVSPLQELDTPTEFLQHIIHTIANYVMDAATDHVNAICGQGTATKISSRSISFPLGAKHPLAKSTKSTSYRPRPTGLSEVEAIFELPVHLPLSLTPSLCIRSRIDSGSSHAFTRWPLDRNIWLEIPGTNFAEKLTSLLL
jgi:hypothetical protein